jgi:2,4'-dihydroxyacetophenone dioxygenase
MGLMQTISASNHLPWVPFGPGKSFKPLAFFREDRGWVLLLRLEPGAVIERHRHTGEVHAFHVQGQRKLGTGEVIGPGDYVYEASGNVDTWAAVGDEPLIVHIAVYGAIEYLDENDRVLARFSASTQYEVYRRYCEAEGVEVADLFA